jgi:hypothetical protein
MQIFPRELNYLPLALAIVAGGLGAGVFILFWVYFTPPNLQVGYTPKQPVEYSHRLHAGELGLDCRYCHSQVERSHEAMVPPTQTCMGCHAVVRTESEKLAPVRESWETDESIAWIRVHQLPDHAFFNHSAPRRPDGGRRGRRTDRDAVVSRMSPQSGAAHSAQE